MCNCISWFTTTEASNLGTFLTGIAALLTVIATIWAIAFEIKRWRHRTIMKKQADIAGRALATILRFHHAIQFITNPFGSTTKDKKDDQEKISKSSSVQDTFNRRLELTKNDFDNFFITMNESQVYLTDEVNMKIEELWKRWVSIKVSFQMYCTYLDQEFRSSELGKHYDNIYSDEGDNLTKKIVDELTIILKPIARMDYRK